MPPTVQELHQRGREAWPRVALPFEAFVEHVEPLLRDGRPMTHPEDLYIACACALGVAGAVAAAEARWGHEIRRAVARIDGSPAFVDEVHQATRVRVFLAEDGARPRIATYEGRGPLGAWLVAAAVRVALNLRGRRDGEPLDELPAELSPADAASPDVLVLRERYKGEFEQAVRDALASLSERERTLLRLHLDDRLSIDRLAVMYRVGRSTAARWLAAARDTLFARTREHLRGRLNLPARDLDSLAVALRSSLDVSVVAILRRDAAG